MFICTPKDILCTVNAQHNCAAHKCETSQIRPIYQERENTGQMKAGVVHSRQPEDFILNTGQMRDAIHVQRHRVPSPGNLDADAIIHASVALEVAKQKSARKAKDSEAPAVAHAEASSARRVGQPSRVAALQGGM